MEREKRVARIEEDLTKPPSIDSLDLVPSYEEERRDLGLSSQDIQATSRVLAGLLKQPDLDPMAPVYVGNLKPALEQQLWHALKREEAEQKLAEKAGVENEERRILVINTLKALGFGGVTVVGGSAIIRLFAWLTSPEVQTAIAEKERQRKEQLEENNILGLIPSAPSYAGWRVKYLPLDHDVEFAQSKEKDSLFIVKNGGFLRFPGNIFGSEDTYISVEDYEKLDGNSGLMLTISLSGSGSKKESWILRDQPTSEIDNRVVVFENIKNGETKYVSITKTKAQPTSFQVELMQRASH